MVNLMIQVKKNVAYYKVEFKSEIFPFAEDEGHMKED